MTSDNDIIVSLKWDLRELPKEEVLPFRYIVIHHSLTDDGECAENWDAIRKYHIRENGWTDIGYHLGIERVAKRLEWMRGRPLTEVGAHAHGFNGSGIGICVVGNFDEKPPDPEVWQSARYMCEILMGHFKKVYDRDLKVLGHRETYKMIGKPVEKSCPGNCFDMDKFREGLCADLV